MTTSHFDGMIDCVTPTENAEYHPVLVPERFNKNDKAQLGIPGVWFVGGSRDYFTLINTADWTGFEVYNCCGTWNVVVPANSQAAARLRRKLGVVSKSLYCYR